MTEHLTIQEAADAHYKSRFEGSDGIRSLLARCETATEDGDYYDRDLAGEEIQQIPLSLQCETIHVQREVVEWSILLGTGGPADRVLVQTDFDGTVLEATYEHQDWFEPWTAALDQDADLVASFAYHFWYAPVSEILQGVDA